MRGGRAGAKAGTLPREVRTSRSGGSFDRIALPVLPPPLAKADIFDVWSYIAVDSQGAAARVEQAIYDACAFLAERLLGGHSGPDLITNPLRFWTPTRYPNDIVVYQPDTAPLQSEAVLHGKRISCASLESAITMASSSRLESHGHNSVLNGMVEATMRFLSADLPKRVESFNYRVARERCFYTTLTKGTFFKRADNWRHLDVPKAKKNLSGA